MHPINDKLKIKILGDEYNLGGSAIGKETGLVVEVPDELIYFAFHNFAFENSLGNQEILKPILDYYKKLEGKIVVWESLQDSGRHFTHNKEEFVLLNMSDVLFYVDEGEIVESINQVGSAGAFNLS